MHPSGAASLAARTWPEAGRPMLLVPVGSIEQHGPHLPLATDGIVAEAVADALAARCAEEGREAAVAPLVAYGASGEHEGFPGTVSIGTSALAFLLLELGRSASAWAGRIVFVNGHGGNLDALAKAVPTLRAEGRDAAWLPCAGPPTAVSPDGDMQAAAPRGDAHAGFVETSLLLHLRPGLVRLERAEPGIATPIGQLLPRLRAEGVRGVSHNGVLGDPTGASAEHGEALFAAMFDAAWARLSRGAADADGCLVAAGP